MIAQEECTRTVQRNGAIHAGLSIDGMSTSYMVSTNYFHDIILAIDLNQIYNRMFRTRSFVSAATGSTTGSVTE